MSYLLSMTSYVLVAGDEWDEGSHPRDEHGRFGSGGSSKTASLARMMLDAVRDENGNLKGDAGFTLHVHTSSPVTHGIAVDEHPERSLELDPKVHDEKAMIKQLIDWRHKNADLLHPPMKIGGWVDPKTSHLWIGVTTVFKGTEVDKAKEAGRKANQIAIANLFAIHKGDWAHAFIDTGGTGKATTDSKPQQHSGARGAMFLFDHDATPQQIARAMRKHLAQDAALSITAFDDWNEEQHQRDDHGRFITGLGNKELPTRVIGGKDANGKDIRPDLTTATHLSNYAALKAAGETAGVKVEQVVVTPEMKMARMFARVTGYVQPDPATQREMLRAFDKAVLANKEKLKDEDGKVVRGENGKSVLVTPAMKLAQVLGKEPGAVIHADMKPKDMVKEFNRAVTARAVMEGGRHETALEKVANMVRSTPGLKIDPKDTPEQVCEKYIEHCVGNLVFLHDSMSAEDRDRAKQWYDGANKIANAFADKHDKTPEQVAGCIAVLSPQKDWFQNVSLAERTMDIMRDKQDHVWDAQMAQWAYTSGKGKTEANGYKDTLRNPGVSKLLHDMEHGGKDGGPKTLAECNGLQRAMFIRAYDEAHNARDYKNLSPEGHPLSGWAGKVNEDGDLLKDKNGNEIRGKIAWDGMANIAKCADIYEHGTPDNIHDKLGDEHKVRNFYNNIISPNSPNGHATIDTHAVAANQLMPLGGGAEDVGKNFGAGMSQKSSGLSGTYALNHEVYVRAAAQVGLLPREMQSITWERVRSLFSAEFKRRDEDQKDHIDEATGEHIKAREGDHKIRGIWAKVKREELDEKTARQQIVEAATDGKGFSSPAWRGRTGTAPIGSPTYAPKLAGAKLPVRSHTGSVSARTGSADAKLDSSAAVSGRRLSITEEHTLSITEKK